MELLKRQAYLNLVECEKAQKNLKVQDLVLLEWVSKN